MTPAPFLRPAPLRTDEGGSIRIGSTRVTLDSLVTAFDEGASAEEIVLRFPSLRLEDVYATITYVLQNRAAVDEYLAARQVEAERWREESERRPGNRALREKLLARRQAATTSS